MWLLPVEEKIEIAELGCLVVGEKYEIAELDCLVVNVLVATPGVVISST